MNVEHADVNHAIPLHKEGTNDTCLVIFPPVTQWLEEYPECSITILHKRVKDAKGLPVSNVTLSDENEPCWLVSSADVRDVGFGEAELCMTKGTKIEKSIETYRTYVAKSVGGNDENPPEPYEGWVSNVLSAANRAETAEQHAEQIEDNIETIIANRAILVDYPDGLPEPSAEYLGQFATVSDGENSNLYFCVLNGGDYVWRLQDNVARYQ